jgi:tetratricopeptide (TPR) repeat protein
MVFTDQSGAVAAGVAAHDRALAELAAGRVVSAREAEGRAVELLRSVFGPTAADVANVLLGAAQIEQAAGDLNAARAFAADAVTAAQTWGLDDADLVGLRFQSEVTLATLDQALGDLEAAEKRLLEALAAARGVAGAERSVLLLSNALGVTYKFAGRLEDAQRCYDEVYDLLQASPDPDPADLAGLFHNLAGLAHSRGDAASGILWAQRGIAHRAALGDSVGLDLARDYGGLGALHHLAGHVQEARDAYAKAERGTVAALGPDHHEVGVVLANQATLEADVGDATAAIDLYRRALVLLSRALSADHAEVCFIQNNLGALLAARATP